MMAAYLKPAIDHDKIWRLHRQGLSSTVIAERLGCSRKTVTTVVAARREVEAAASDGRSSA